MSLGSLRGSQKNLRKDAIAKSGGAEPSSLRVGVGYELQREELSPDNQDGYEEQRREQAPEAPQAEGTRRATVTDPNALIRAEPDFESTGDRIPEGAEVIVLEEREQGGLTVARVRVVETGAEVWTSAGNLTLLPEPRPRDISVDAVRTWLEARIEALEGLEGQARVERIQGLLGQLERVFHQINTGQRPNLQRLSAAPRGLPAGEPPAQGFAPPELVGLVRDLIVELEVGVEGGVEAEGAAPETSRASGIDWNARLGVPQYRTQSDNLAAPEATCNTTGLAMALERLGYNRGDVVAAIDRELEAAVEAAMTAQTEEGGEADRALALKEVWEDRVRGYLDDLQRESRGYRRVRGESTTGEQRQAMAEDFLDNAQMEDLIDFLAHLKNFVRIGLIGDEGISEGMLEAIEPNAEARPEGEVIWSSRTQWATHKGTIREVLEGGGAAVLSIYHKGSGSDATHLISVQSVTAAGVIVDDPYGQIRDTYRRNRSGDAYADPGSTRAGSDHMNEVHLGEGGEYGVGDDWTARRAADLEADESRGDSYLLSDTIAARAVRFIRLFRRG